MSREIETRPFGKMQIEEKQILHFPEGLMGFEEFTNYALIEENDETPFKWLQSLDDKNLAFIVIEPFLFEPNYKPQLDKEEIAQIEISDISESLLMVIVTIPQDPNMMTANLQGPILINPKIKKAKQYISRDEKHPVRKLILEQTSETK